ncbi:MAG: hypothetical protein CMP62_03820 [Flavobacteriales bacterium]|nr:hypothetical protein [Flavobacteriales bacterium]|tara:strand:- start:1090 stop:1716 length:627 start_codon:yes stop_codon:yes gene_type:complete
MKKKIFVLFCLLFVNVFSQDLTTRKGEAILPEAGDWSIGTSVHPFIDFIDNIFTSESNDKPLGTPSFGDDLYFYMKKFVSPDRAFRYVFGADFDMREETWNIGLGYGVERRKGNTRLQGMWGYNGFIGVGDTFDSADLLSIPTTIYEDTYNMNVSMSLFIGCEYFILAKIAVGAEYHYGFNMNIANNETFFDIGGNANTTTMKINFYF